MLASVRSATAARPGTVDESVSVRASKENTPRLTLVISRQPTIAPNRAQTSVERRSSRYVAAAGSSMRRSMLRPCGWPGS